jgi:trk system potassium uptake protein TrkA
VKNERIEKREGKLVTEQHISGVPTSQTMIKENDFLVLFGLKKDIEKFIEINE